VSIYRPNEKHAYGRLKHISTPPPFNNVKKFMNFHVTLHVFFHNSYRQFYQLDDSENLEILAHDLEMLHGIFILFPVVLQPAV
jgi:hypothetical protein